MLAHRSFRAVEYYSRRPREYVVHMYINDIEMKMLEKEKKKWTRIIF